MKKYIKLFRIEQWIKNIFVFLPLFFSGYFLHLELFSVSLFAFFIFSFTASCIYIINDYIDIEADKKHRIGRTKVSKAIWALTGSPGRQKIGVPSTVPTPSCLIEDRKSVV